MTSIKHILAAEREQNNAIIKSEYSSHRKFYSVSNQDFWSLLKLKAQKILVQRKVTNPVLRSLEYQHRISEQLWFYFTGNKQFKGDFNKGIWLHGPNGTGKSLLLHAFIQCFAPFGKNIAYRTAKELGLTIKTIEQINMLSKKPMLIDDLARETKEANDFKAVIHPIGDLLFQRYDNGGWTFVTSNFAIEDPVILKKYGVSVVDRMKAMFNQFELKGDSQR